MLSRYSFFVANFVVSVSCYKSSQLVVVLSLVVCCIAVYSTYLKAQTRPISQMVKEREATAIDEEEDLAKALKINAAWNEKIAQERYATYFSTNITSCVFNLFNK